MVSALICLSEGYLLICYGLKALFIGSVKNFVCRAFFFFDVRWKFFTLESLFKRKYSRRTKFFTLRINRTCLDFLLNAENLFCSSLEILHVHRCDKETKKRSACDIFYAACKQSLRCFTAFHMSSLLKHYFFAKSCF